MILSTRALVFHRSVLFHLRFRLGAGLLGAIAHFFRDSFHGIYEVCWSSCLHSFFFHCSDYIHEMKLDSCVIIYLIFIVSHSFNLHDLLLRVFLGCILYCIVYFWSLLWSWVYQDFVHNWYLLPWYLHCFCFFACSLICRRLCALFKSCWNILHIFSWYCTYSRNRWTVSSVSPHLSQVSSTVVLLASFRLGCLFFEKRNSLDVEGGIRCLGRTKLLAWTPCV